MKKQEIKNKFLEFYPKYKENVAYTKLANWLADMDTTLFDKAGEAAENASYNTKKYTSGFVTTCISKELGQLVSWEASRYPKAAAVVGFAILLCRE